MKVLEEAAKRFARLEKALASKLDNKVDVQSNIQSFMSRALPDNPKASRGPRPWWRRWDKE